MFLKNRNISSKIKRSKVTDYAALSGISLPTGKFCSANFFKINLLRHTNRVSNSLDPGQAQRFVGPDLDPNCLQRLSTDDTSR